jgi:EAL domain-containing protein (putative c-di-GMP-specific phosphodiesterase class I)
MGVTVEGVETGGQSEFLTPYDCDLLQGFLYSKAGSREETT